MWSGNEPLDLGEVAALVVERFQAAPACVVGAARRGPLGSSGPLVDPSPWRLGVGSAGRLWTVAPSDEEAPAVRPDHLFDLASLTKPVTALVLARLERAGIVARSERLGDVVPELAASAAGALSLDLLAAHRAGLEAHLELFVKRADARQPTRAAALTRAAEGIRDECRIAPPSGGFPCLYSDLGYILLGAALEARTGRRLDALVEDEVARPLGLSLGLPRGLRLGSIDVFRDRGVTTSGIVPTEQVPWRGGVLQGVVHDENAWILAGTGTAGHAGLFADVAAIVALGMAVLDAWHGRDDRWLRRSDLEPVLRPREGGSHAAGFDRKSGPNPSSGARFGAATFGHLGFTGTSIWIDPDEDLVGVLLTNRVHPSRDHVAIRAARPAAYDALFERMVG